MAIKQLQPAGEFPATGLLRRLAGAAYDLFLLIALWMITTFAYLGMHIAAAGEELTQQQAEAGAFVGDVWLSLILLVVTWGFYVVFWTKKGQTLGMQVWRVRVEQLDGRSITVRQATIRFLVAQAAWLCGGLGFFWQLWDNQSRTWQDIASGTRLVTLPKNAYRKD
ncbi:RDD family protein [Halopseudomonas xinjiangensis]|uniref:RDD family protein n=1 Tax=Halopseudomonas xinjiangensis TaxID=487184 RepID=A0A1H1VU67_9GAMM|nr:RDD family protein [Halopseudomonas xinjiangensis]SDS87970.1 RDD family protein [Halopseudomonas xinjiangensis]